MNSWGERICFDIAWADASVILFALLTIIVLLLTKTKKANEPWFWLVPFSMLIAALVFKALTHEGSVFMQENESSDFWEFYGDTFYDAMAVLWAALLGAVFIPGPGKTKVDGESKSRSMEGRGRSMAKDGKEHPEKPRESFENAFEILKESEALHRFKVKDVFLFPVVFLVVSFFYLICPSEGMGYIVISVFSIAYLSGVASLAAYISPHLWAKKLDGKVEAESRVLGKVVLFSEIDDQERHMKVEKLKDYIGNLEVASLVFRVLFVLSPVSGALLGLSFSRKPVSYENVVVVMAVGVMVVGTLILMRLFSRSERMAKSLLFCLQNRVQ